MTNKKGQPVSGKSLDTEHGSWLTPPQAVGRIPGCSNVKSVRELIAKNEITYFEKNGRFYISDAAIRAYIRRNTRKAA